MAATASPVALVKPLLHAAKYPQAPVNGVLLGSADSASTSGSVTIRDAIPLFHSGTTLAMPVEVALAQIEAWTQTPDAGGLKIVGYYHSDAKFAPGELGPTGRRIADRIADRNAGAGVAVVLDNVKLGAFVKGEEAHPFDLYTREGSRGWKKGGELRLHGGAAWSALQEEFFSLFKQQKHRSLVDFDEHMDDVSKCYFNKHLEKFALPGQKA